MEEAIRLVLLFFIYSFIGWCTQVTLKAIQYHRFINRGFLAGPVCPIYGSGAVLITMAVHGITRFESSLGTTFVVSFFLCGVLEYMTSLVMEKCFHARWWDYSQKPMNLHGRVWIGNLLLFGLGGVVIIHGINPLVLPLINAVSVNGQRILAGCLAAVFVTDAVMTLFILKMVRAGIEKSEADNTEEIGREIRLLLSDKSIFHRRFADAYPEVVYQTERIKARVAAVKAESERLRKEAEQRLRAQKQQVISSLEPAALIKNSIIDKQDELITLLYNEDTANERARQLMQEIDQERERLDTRPLARAAKAGRRNK